MSFATRPLISLLLLFCCVVSSTFAEATATTYQLPGSTAGVGRDNGVVLGREGTVWITAADGTLTILYDGSEASFQPTTLSGRSTECRSSVTLHEVDEFVEYGVYSVVDTPTSDEDTIVR